MFSIGKNGIFKSIGNSAHSKEFLTFGKALLIVPPLHLQNVNAHINSNRYLEVQQKGYIYKKNTP